MFRIVSLSRNTCNIFAKKTELLENCDCDRWTCQSGQIATTATKEPKPARQVDGPSGADCEFCFMVQSIYQALRLCLVTQCKRGSVAPPSRKASFVCELGRQEPPLQCIPRQSLGTSKTSKVREAKHCDGAYDCGLSYQVRTPSFEP